MIRNAYIQAYYFEKNVCQLGHTHSLILVINTQASALHLGEWFYLSNMIQWEGAELLYVDGTDCGAFIW